ncbi:rhomboid family intramembrane serine protease [Glaesserella sp.]|uniref:rhomboid family intramembrane serine protease n=1 Tax=Glaesserella sp. TaxID=2094731 RepID=UPI0035A0049F
MVELQSLKEKPFTVLITLVCLIVYGLEYIGFQQSVFELFHYPAYVGQNWQLWRYFSHSLVHLSEMHILFNLLWWWQFAAIVERYIGSTKLIAIYMLSAVLTGFAQNAMSGPAFFGLSGVVYAVLAYVFAANRFTHPSPLNLPDSFLYSLLIAIGIGFVSPMLLDINMGNTAHITGLLLGLVWGFIDAKRYARLR